MRDNNPDITISIVNSNNIEITLQCLESVYATAGELLLQTVVVNNACLDGSTEAVRGQFPQVEIIEHEQRLGFSTNNNLALARARGRYWMLLNDDTIVQPGAFQAMVRFMDENPGAGVTGAALLNRDGSAQYCYDFVHHPLYDGLRPFSEFLLPPPRGGGGPLEVGYVSGACLMTRAEAARQVGLLDTRYDPLYSEEVDWCYRFWQTGWKVFHLPQARVIHLGEVAVRKSSLRRYERIYAKKTIFFRKYYGERGAWLYKITLWITNLFKVLFWLVMSCIRKQEARQELEIHWNIVQQALRF